MSLFASLDTFSRTFLIVSFPLHFQIPFGVLAKRYGALGFLGWGMFINSIFGFLVPISAQWGVGWLILVRFIQGLGEGPIVSHEFSRFI